MQKTHRVNWPLYRDSETFGIGLGKVSQAQFTWGPIEKASGCDQTTQEIPRVITSEYPKTFLLSDLMIPSEHEALTDFWKSWSTQC